MDLTSVSCERRVSQHHIVTKWSGSNRRRIDFDPWHSKMELARYVPRLIVRQSATLLAGQHRRPRMIHGLERDDLHRERLANLTTRSLYFPTQRAQCHCAIQYALRTYAYTHTHTRDLVKATSFTRPSRQPSVTLPPGRARISCLMPYTAPLPVLAQLYRGDSDP